ncbi:phenylalanine--tRNA ligase subunit alpha [Mariprofundus erugo]|uniref:Phenylalanine--tRNA ligase alpha subunit n=1 Tax=Mariprofundus erugo TaxID=2528639 RepID=A0A5R9GRC6_9PROT|nr:phenylalanine--tRNA ligase subunit alpha [Mariprofundus erugo]TLS65744.1 phenylalanine--tRNA ligase subunit alpha [Mariprofundus erugo]TLS77940.1 phenylalanine--tRNA ligase subunit alpha [Mariprofundus erugo]
MSEIDALKVQLESLQSEALAAFAAAENPAALQQLRVHYLGKKGALTEVLKGVGRLPPEARPVIGQYVNDTKAVLAGALERGEAELAVRAKAIRIQAERIDITLPGRKAAAGGLHPVQQGLDEMTEIFSQMGFAIAEGPEIEDEFHNFDALNIPPEHPARAMHDTFFIKDMLNEAGTEPMLLRTHTSPVQIRAMKRFLSESGEPPLAVVAPGRVYRCDYDVTHSPMFHQVEVFKVDRNVSMAHLKGVLRHFLSAYFEKDVGIRLRPHYFPFTEPSAEVDISCVFCASKGCRICKGSGWIEVLGSGMIHPNVLRAVGIDSSEFSGFAFGLGVERLVMLKQGIPDLRLFFENDVRFLRKMGGTR